VRAFEYVAAETIDEALAMLARYGEDAKVLAGGQSLVPLLNYRLVEPRVVVDINALPLDAVGIVDGRLRLGALTRYTTLEESAEIRGACPLLAEAARLIGNVRVRTLGTLGGSLAHADPAAELPMAMLALDAHFRIVGRDDCRTVPVRDFFRGHLTTALAPGELLSEVDVPVGTGQGYAIEEYARRVGDFALVAVAVVLNLDRRGRVDDARISFAGVGPTPMRVLAAEDTLLGREPTPEHIAETAVTARDALDPSADPFASAPYRKLLAGVLSRRALARAVGRAIASGHPSR
jgi:aerobic carbon-monoxide dehydrogenase medium subunit